MKTKKKSKPKSTPEITADDKAWISNFVQEQADRTVESIMNSTHKDFTTKQRWLVSARIVALIYQKFFMLSIGPAMDVIKDKEHELAKEKT